MKTARRCVLVSVTVAAFVAAMALGGCRNQPAPESGLDYIEVVTGPAAADAPLPLLIAIHGLGDRPEAFCEFMKSGIRVRARIICPRAPNVYGNGYSWFPPMRTLTSADRLAAAVEDAGDRVALLTRVLARDARALGRPVLTGYSQGGMTSYYLAAMYSDLYAAVVPVAGMLPEPLRRRELRGQVVPIYGYHGKSDELVPYSEAKRTAEALTERWPQTQFTGYDGVGHRLSSAMRRDLFDRLTLLLKLP